MIRVFGYLAWRSARNRGLPASWKHPSKPALRGCPPVWRGISLVHDPGSAANARRERSRATLPLARAARRPGPLWGGRVGLDLWRRAAGARIHPGGSHFSVRRAGFPPRPDPIQVTTRVNSLILFNASAVDPDPIPHERFGVSPWLRAASHLGSSSRPSRFIAWVPPLVRTSLSEHGRFGARHPRRVAGGSRESCSWR